MVTIIKIIIIIIITTTVIVELGANKPAFFIGFCNGYIASIL